MQRKTNRTQNGQASKRSLESVLSARPLKTARKMTGWSAWPALALLAFVVVGCGTNVNEVLYQTAAAAGRTMLDVWLTDLANELADAVAADDMPPVDGDQDGNGDGDGDGEPSDGADFTGLIGDPAAGEAIYASCAGCHCADASGGCLPGATGLIGVSAETHDEFLRGGATHPAKPDLTDQEIVDLVAYLDSLGG